MKRVISLLLCMMIICCACGNSSERDTSNKIKLEQTQVRNIAELATLECYYHNVCKYHEDNTSGWWIWSKDTHFWAEYEGIVKMGVEASKIKMDVKGNNVTISIPKAKLLDAKVNEKTFNKKSFYIEEGTTKPDSKVQVEALNQAQEDMKNEAKNDPMLLANAQSQTQSLIEKYVKNVGKLINRDYVIKWNDLG